VPETRPRLNRDSPLNASPSHDPLNGLEQSDIPAPLRAGDLARVATADARDLHFLFRLGLLVFLLFDQRFAHETQQARRALEKREYLTSAMIATTKAIRRGAISAEVASWTAFGREVERWEAQGAAGQEGSTKPTTRESAIEDGAILSRAPASRSLGHLCSDTSRSARGGCASDRGPTATRVG